MRAAQLQAYGAADNIKVVDVPVPEPGPKQVLVKIAYAGLRWSDITGRRGQTGRGFPTPYTLGSEAVGVIEEVGPEVTDFKVGDRVVAQPSMGAFAEYLAVDASRCEIVPDHVPLESVLVYRVNMVVAHLMIHEWAKVQDGEMALVHAAAGGVGSMVTQILKRRFSNVTVFGTVGSDEKAAWAREYGVDHAINYKTHDYVAEIDRLVGVRRGFAPTEAPAGVHVVFNGVGGHTLRKDRKVLRKHGRWVIFGASGGVEPVNLYENVYDSIAILPFSVLTYWGTPAVERAQAFTDEWLRTEALLKPTVYPLEQAAAAEGALERGETIGKVVLQP